MLAGFDSKKSDILGLAIRGGSVVSHIRWGDKVNAPMAMVGTVDYLLAFEPLEALRQLEYLNPECTVVFNEYKIPPVDVSSGLAEYPEEEVINTSLRKTAKKVYSFNATGQALEIGSVKTVNVILIGALSALIDVDVPVWEEAIRKFVPAKYGEFNLKAFHKGRELINAMK